MYVHIYDRKYKQYLSFVRSLFDRTIVCRNTLLMWCHRPSLDPHSDLVTSPPHQLANDSLPRHWNCRKPGHISSPQWQRGENQVIQDSKEPVQTLSSSAVSQHQRLRLEPAEGKMEEVPSPSSSSLRCTAAQWKAVCCFMFSNSIGWAHCVARRPVFSWITLPSNAFYCLCALFPSWKLIAKWTNGEAKHTSPPRWRPRRLAPSIVHFHWTHLVLLLYCF